MQSSSVLSRYFTKEKFGVNNNRFIILDLINLYPQKSILVLFLMFFSGIFEGVSFLTLVPLIQSSQQDQPLDTPYMDYFLSVYKFLGLEQNLLSSILIIFLCILLKSILVMSALNKMGRVMAEILSDMRTKLFESVIYAEWKFFVDNEVGKIINSAIVETPKAASTYHSGIKFIAAIIQVVLYLSFAIIISPYVTLFSLFGALVLAIFLNKFIRLAKSAGSESVRTMKSISSTLSNYLQGIKAIKAMSKEKWVLPMLEVGNKQMIGVISNQILAKNGLSILREPIVVGILSVGYYLCLNYFSLSFAEVAAISIVFYRTANTVGQVQMSYQTMMNLQDNYISVKETINRSKHFAKSKNTFLSYDFPLKQFEFVMEGIHFSFGENKILNNLNFRISHDQMVAIVGESGAGKTTFIDIVCGLMKPQVGQVYIQSQNKRLDDKNLFYLQSRIGYVPQELTLFHSSVRDNLTLGNAKVDDNQLIDILKSVDAWGFVEKLDRQLDTIIGERGSTLSGGQRQRLSIARAIAQNPLIIILDEATTALDPITESKVIATLKKIAENIPIIAISHQKAIVDASDVVYEMRDKKLFQVS